jgi:hypothetical protein
MKIGKRFKRVIPLIVAVALISVYALPGTIASATVVDSATIYNSTFHSVGGAGSIAGLGLTTASNYTGMVYMKFTVTPAVTDGESVIGYADSTVAGVGESDLAMMVKLKADGFIYVTNGANDEKTVAYTTAAKTILIAADMTAKTYTVYTSTAGVLARIGTANSAFSTAGNGATAANVGQVFFLQDSGTSGVPTFTVSNHMIGSPASMGSGLITTSQYSTGAPWNTEYLFLKGYSLGTSNTGVKNIQFDLTPGAVQDDQIVGFADANIPVSQFNDCAITFAMTDGGKFDAKAGSWAGSTYAYTAGTKYHIEIVVNVSAKTYTIYATDVTNSGTKTAVVTDFGFRSAGLGGVADDIGQVIPAQGQATSYTVENFALTAGSTPTTTETPSITPSPDPVSPTATPTPATGDVSVSNDVDLANALASASVTSITLGAGTYAGFTINNPVVINGGGATVSSGITINANSVTVNNLNVIASTSLTNNPGGENENRHGYSIAPSLTGTVINGGSVTSSGLDSPINAKAKAIWFQVVGVVPDTGALAENSNNGSATITNVTFPNVRNGVVCNGADSLVITGCTFTGNRVGIGSTEFTTMTTVTGNTFNTYPTNGVEGIGIGQDVAYTGQTDIVAFLIANNTFDTSYDTDLKKVHDYRVVVTPTPTPGTPTPAPSEIPVSQGVISTLTTYNALLYSTTAPWSDTTYLQGNGYTTSAAYTGKQDIQYDVTPGDVNLDESVGYADSNTLVQVNDDLAMQVRMNNTTSSFDVRNGSAFASTNAVAYVAGTKYHVQIIVNFTTKKYSVWVTPNGGTKTQIASNYSFRSGGNGATADDIGQVFIVKAAEAHSFTVANHMIRPIIDSVSSYDNYMYNPLVAPVTNMNFLQGLGYVIEKPVTGTAVRISLDVTPSGISNDTLMGFTGSNALVKVNNDLAMLVAMKGGTFWVRNSGGFVDTAFGYSLNTKYTILLVGNMTTKTYSVWVTPDGGSKTQIATDYGFRTGGAGITSTDIGQVYFTQEYADNNYTVTNFAIVSESTMGDVNGSGSVNTTDALLALQMYTEKITPNAQQILAADVNKSGAVNTTDALRILQFYTEKIIAF